MKAEMNTILIADREPAYRDQIRRYIGNRPGFRVVGECGNCHEAVRFVNALEPDVLFLDVQLGGDRAFRLMQETDHLPRVIYTAPSDVYAARAFDHHAIDYLLKPHGAARLDAALEKIMHGATAVNPPKQIPMPRSFCRNLFVEDGTRLRRIAMRDIRYLRAAGDYTVVYSDKGEFLSSSGIGRIDGKLDHEMFVRVHRSYIINLERVDACYRDIGKLYLVMEDGKEIGVGKYYMNSIKLLIL